ncbi:SusC/RagA family TonB-linked outer membrane protein [Chryseolinea lacunae]|uniref:TonB-dependent receptor n=1 Tax=Chryseolinea lacunae TaxID=2801331 RepID=A0ABS1KKF3_9BACT|nr:TonB-dependent receptor [Chryseolinea lacunae]MBL0739804.1 TonB-dependent receptor [Chryseolinea lacunae]
MNLKHLLKRLLSTAMMLMTLWVAAQAAPRAVDITIQGKVSSSDDGATLPGVNIIVKGTSIGTTTDADGKYSISVPNAESVLVFTFIGYKTQEAVVGSRTAIDISLESDVETLSEIVVVGYGEQKKETLTGSISQVKGDDIVKSPQPNVSNSLAGRFSGIIASNRGGEPGYDGSTFTIRGQATTGSNDVLVVVDGIPGQLGGLERLNPNDIESISILKDASAAVYGSRAANGVILVTTKRGKSGKPTIAYSFNQGFSSPTRLPHMADAATYATIQNEIDYYTNNAGGMNQHYSEAEIQKFRDGSDPLNYPNTNWAKETLKKVALQNQHNLSIKGGTEDVHYYVSLGKTHQDGLYKNGATQYNQYSFRSNIDANVTKDFKVSLSLSGRQEDRKYPTYGANDIFRSIYRAYPTTIATYPNGLPSTGVENNNPVVMATDMGGTNMNPQNVFNGILRASYALPFVKGLSIDGFYSVDKIWNFGKVFSQPYTLYRYNSGDGTYSPVVTGGSSGLGKMVESQDNTSMITDNLKLNYEKQLGNHYVSAFVAYEQSKVHRETFNATRLNYPTIQTPELSQGGSAATDRDNTGSSFNYARKSYIGKLAYNYKEKYLFEAQMRIDGTSNFPAGHRYGYFPAVSAGWRISEEGWFSNVEAINDLKIRASYGELGNDNANQIAGNDKLTQFQYFNNYSFNNVYVIGGDKHPGIDLTKLANPEITWEVAKKTDIGLNATVARNITFEFIYFTQDRSRILTPRNASIPGVSGIANPFNDNSANYAPLVPFENIGKVRSSGFETTIGYNKRQGDFWYGASANMTLAKSKIIFIDEASGTLDYQRQTGRPLNTYLLYNAIGIFRTQADIDSNPHLANAKLGDLIYEDYNKDGKITADDQVRTEYGNIPQITYGVNLSGGWKNFDIALLFAGQGRVNQYVLAESGTVGNFYSTWADNRWSPTNPEGSYPRVDNRASSSVNGGLYKNNFWLNNSSFVRLKNVSIGYNVPTTLLSKYRISALRLYANAFNLFTITKVKDYDPEGSSESGQFYPQQRIINVGVNIQF